MAYNLTNSIIYSVQQFYQHYPTENRIALIDGLYPATLNDTTDSGTLNFTSIISTSPANDLSMFFTEYAKIIFQDEYNIATATYLKPLLDQLPVTPWPVHYNPLCDFSNKIYTEYFPAANPSYVPCIRKNSSRVIVPPPRLLLDFNAPYQVMPDTGGDFWVQVITDALSVLNQTITPNSTTTTPDTTSTNSNVSTTLSTTSASSQSSTNSTVSSLTTLPTSSLPNNATSSSSSSDSASSSSSSSQAFSTTALALTRRGRNYGALIHIHRRFILELFAAVTLMVAIINLFKAGQAQALQPFNNAFEIARSKRGTKSGKVAISDALNRFASIAANADEEKAFMLQMTNKLFSTDPRIKYISRDSMRVFEDWIANGNGLTTIQRTTFAKKLNNMNAVRGTIELYNRNKPDDQKLDPTPYLARAAALDTSTVVGMDRIFDGSQGGPTFDQIQQDITNTYSDPAGITKDIAAGGEHPLTRIAHINRMMRAGNLRSSLISSDGPNSYASRVEALRASDPATFDRVRTTMKGAMTSTPEYHFAQELVDIGEEIGADFTGLGPDASLTAVFERVSTKIKSGNVKTSSLNDAFAVITRGVDSMHDQYFGDEEATVPAIAPPEDMVNVMESANGLIADAANGDVQDGGFFSGQSSSVSKWKNRSKKFSKNRLGNNIKRGNNIGAGSFFRH